MYCNNKYCKYIDICDILHKNNGIAFNNSDTILLSDEMLYTLNINNRLAKSGLKDGFKWGCFTIIEYEKSDGFLYYKILKDNNLVDVLSLTELLDLCNGAFRSLIAEGKIRLG